MITCQICQHENPEGAEYCENCGAALASSAPASATPATPAAETGAATTPQEPAAPQSTPAEGGTSTPGTAPLTPDTLPGDVDAMPAADADPSLPAMSTGDTVSSEAQAAAETAGVPGDQRPRLTPIRHGAPAGDSYPLMGDRLVVGRFDAETGPVDIDLSDAPEAEQISRNHAEMYRDADGTWYVQDLGSTNGVFVRSAGATRFGPRLTAPQALTSGDELSFGNSRFRFEIETG